jgi:DNA invertase Pin-like site-specific DNA recombinase
MKKLEKGEMTVSQLGKMGGLARAAKCTPEQLSAIGRHGYAMGLGKYSSAELGKMLRTHRRRHGRLTEKQIARIKQLFKSGVPQARIAEAFRVARPTIARHLGRKKRRKTVK